MRVSNHPARFIAASIAIAAMLLTACGAPPAVPSAAPTARPTPVVTPDPHLVEPATADDVFRAIGGGDLRLTVNNATSGDATSALVKRISADISNWPLVITQYRSGAELRKAKKWNAAKPLANGDPPYAFVGLNILVEFGPVTGKLAAPDQARREQVQQMIALIDPLLWPLEQRALVPVAVRAATPASAALAGSPAPSKAP